MVDNGVCFFRGYSREQPHITGLLRPDELLGDEGICDPAQDQARGSSRVGVDLPCRADPVHLDWIESAVVWNVHYLHPGLYVAGSAGADGSGKRDNGLRGISLTNSLGDDGLRFRPESYGLSAYLSDNRRLGRKWPDARAVPGVRGRNE